MISQCIALSIFIYSVFIFFYVKQFGFCCNMDPNVEKFLLLLLKILLQIYTFVTIPIYWLLQQPWKVRAKHNQQRVNGS